MLHHVRSKHIYQALVVKCLRPWGGLSCGEEALLPAPADSPDGQNTTCGARGAFGAFIFLFCFVLYERRMGSNQ
jgi:hypothetical protein